MLSYRTNHPRHRQSIQNHSRPLAAILGEAATSSLYWIGNFDRLLHPPTKPPSSRSAHVRPSRCGTLSEAPFGGYVTRSGTIRLLLPSVPTSGLFELFLVQFVFGKLRLGVGVAAHDLLLCEGATVSIRCAETVTQVTLPTDPLYYALAYGFLTTSPNAVVEPIHPKRCP